MNFRLTAILFGLLLVLTLVLLGVTFLDDTPTVSGTVFEELALAGVKPDQIDTVEIESTDPGGKLVFIRAGKDRWEVLSPVKAKANSQFVDAVVSSLMSAKPVATPETAAPLADLGLASPSLKVTLRKGSDQSATLNLGNVAIGGDRALTFVSNSAHPDRAMAVRRSELDPLFREDAKKSTGQPAATFAKGLSEFRNPRPIGPDPQAAATQVASLTLTAKGKSLTLANTKDGWKIETPALGAADLAGDATPTPNQFTGVRPLLAALTGVQVVSPKDFVESPKDLKEYGLNADNPDLVKIELKTADGGTDIAYLGQKVKDEPGKVYAKLEGDPAVFKATGNNLDGLAAAVANPVGLRDRNLLAVDKTQIDALDLAVGGRTTKLRRTPTGWALFGGPNDPQPAAPLPVENLTALLAERRTIRDYPAANDAAFAPTEVKAEVKVWTDAVAPNADAKKEPELKSQPTVLIFGKKEGDAYFVRRIRPDGTKTDLLLPDTVPVGPGRAPMKVLETVAKTRADFLELKLPSFAPTIAAKLTITRAGGETIALSKSPTLDPQYPRGRWAFDLPEARKGQPANADKVFTLLEDLASLNAIRVVDEQPTEEALRTWGLDLKAPKVRVAVTLDAKEDAARAYDFGNESEDKNHVYARFAGKPQVFLVSKFAVERFGPGLDLRDPTVLAFDRARLKGLKLRGWAGPGRPATQLELEFKDGKWTAKAPPMFVVDSAKVEQLVNALYNARAKAFVGPRKDEYGFAVDTQNALEVTLELDGGLPALLLNLGAKADGGASLYAYSNQHPNDILTVPAEPFQAIKEKPGALAK